MKQNIQKIEQWGPLDAILLYTCWFYRTVKEMDAKNWNTQWCSFYIENDRHRLTAYYPEDIIKQRGKEAIDNWILPQKSREELWQMYTEHISLVKEKYSFFKELSEDEKLDKISSFIIDWEKLITEFSKIVSIPEIANFGAPSYLKDVIAEKVSESDMNHVLEVLLAPIKLSFHQKAELAFLKLFIEYYKTKDWEEKLQIFIKDWHWVDNSYFEVSEIDVDPWIKEFSKLNKDELNSRLEQINNYCKKVKKRKKEVVKKYKLDSTIENLANQLSFSIWWQDDRKGLIWWYLGFLKEIATYIGKKYNIKFHDLQYYFLDELYQLAISGKTVPSNLVKKRQGYWAVLLEPGNIKEYYGDEAKEFIKQYRDASEKNYQTSEIISGIVACRSSKLVRGKVKVIHSSRESDFKQGDILVAPMTSPDFIHLMRKAKAIITDIGGLMSHASVVSRELDVPCIVGTKVATKRLKTGDNVEINTKTGIIKKID